MKNNLNSILIEIAFNELHNTNIRQENELKTQKEAINDLKTLVFAMDEKIDSLIARIKNLEDSVLKRNVNENSFYNTYKNGEE